MLRTLRRRRTPLDLLKSEQDRIAKRLAHLDARINATDVQYETAKAHLDDCLALAGDCNAIYMSIDDSLRRIAKQAFFERIYVSEIDTIDPELGPPFDVLFNPAVQAEALLRQAAPGRQRRGTRPFFTCRGFEQRTFGWAARDSNPEPMD
jgi:site-specific DNA recombinase